MNRRNSHDETRQLWCGSKFLAGFLIGVLCIDIAASIAVPEHDSVRFAGKYLLFAIAISLAFKRSSNPVKSNSLKWRIVVAAFALWTLGFSLDYLSESLYGQLRPIYQYLHDASYLLKILCFIWATLLPEGEIESNLDRYSRWSSMLLMTSVYICELVVSIRFCMSGKRPGVDLFDLTDKYSCVFIVIVVLAMRVLSSNDRKNRVFYSSLLACMVLHGFFDNSICAQMFMWITKSRVLWDIGVADLPMIAFVTVIVCDLDLGDWYKKPVHGVFVETAPSSLSLVLPIATGFMSLFLWRAYPYLVAASVVGLVCIFVYAVQSFVSHIYSQKQLHAAFNEKALLESIVQKDPVTGVYSRRWFDETISLGCRNAQEGKPSIVIFMIDVDNFKGYNDTLGHKAGDCCLRAVASALRSALGRERDFVARYGGDEMAAVLFQTNADGALAVAERMLKAVWDLNIAHPRNPDKRVTVSIGIGIAGSIPGLIVPSDLVLAADAALYESKARGKNTATIRESKPVADDMAPAIVISHTPSRASTINESFIGDIR